VTAISRDGQRASRTVSYAILPSNRFTVSIGGIRLAETLAMEHPHVWAESAPRAAESAAFVPIQQRPGCRRTAALTRRPIWVVEIAHTPA
jgi:hypothetical protein